MDALVGREHGERLLIRRKILTKEEVDIPLLEMVRRGSDVSDG